MGIFEVSALFAVMIPLAAMPSASVALVVSRSLSAGRASGGFAALGIVAGDLVFVAMALLGAAVLADQLSTWFGMLKYCGAAYLIYLGLKLLRSAPAMAYGQAQHGRTAFAKDFLAGLLLTLGDIKAVFFYASLFPALIDVGQLGLLDAIIIAAVTLVAVGGVKLTYVLFASKMAGHLEAKLSSTLMPKLAGGLLVACGVVLAANGWF